MKVYRPARPAGTAWNLLKTGVQTAAFWSLFLFVLPAAIVQFEKWLGIATFAPSRIAGGVMFTICSSLGLWSGITMACSGQGTPLPFDTARRLVVAGPYRHVRNPMAIAGIGQGIAVGVWLGSPATLVYALLGAAAWHFVARPGEEADLRERFGDAYDRYRAAVPLWLPRRLPWSSP